MELISNETDFEADTPYTELLLGCGKRRDKEFCFPPDDEGRQSFRNLVTLDISEAVNPDVVHDMDVLPYPFQDNEFDEIHAYEVLEHTGTQGDVDFFFAQFDELARILKPDGLLLASVPMWDSPWAWSDPGHRRVISSQTLAFLERDRYDEQAEDSPMADYRPLFSSNWKVIGIQETEHRFYFVMQVIK